MVFGIIALCLSFEPTTLIFGTVVLAIGIILISLSGSLDTVIGIFDENIKILTEYRDSIKINSVP